jgi:tetratricopeptide (TPR) repeat protein
LGALETAKTVPAEGLGRPNDLALSQHLSNAGKMIKAGRASDAENELAASRKGNSGKTESGFVMGLILMHRERWQEACEIYSEILRLDPDFPQVHTRLSNTYFNSGNPEQALKEAKFALERNPTIRPHI